jgi:hypothetical protein
MDDAYAPEKTKGPPKIDGPNSWGRRWMGLTEARATTTRADASDAKAN